MPDALSSSCFRSGLVEDQPVQTELTHGIGELAEIHRLAHIAIGAEAIAIDSVAFFVRGSQDHDRKASCALIASNSPKHFEAIHFGQF